METEERIDRIEDVIVLMKTLLLRHEDRLDDFDEKFRKSREDFEFRMNAVIDSQIRTESELIVQKESISKLEESTSNLKDASRGQLKRIERLEQI